MALESEEQAVASEVGGAITGRKRSLEVEKEKENKNKKNKVGNHDGGGKMPFLDNQRKWSKGDEILILKGMIDYKNKCINPNDIDNAEFLASLKESLDYQDANEEKLVIKKRRMKQKYKAIVERLKDGNSSKPHEDECYHLMKLIWGEEDKVKELDMQKRKVEMQQIELHLKCLDVERALTKAALDAIKAADS